MKRIITLKAFKSDRITKNKQNRNKEFILLLACVSAISRAIPPLLIYKSKSGDLQDTWMQDVRPEDGIFFASSDNKWSNKKLELV
ncbi:hypothetical protein BDZ45DRAFT_59404 [Acephala macrosclerotiorum]|nr:hypothetical protein BDZ45DRAFT_59404 [Acephala macrosclerotiorum]